MKSNFVPDPRDTGITCEWSYLWNPNSACGMELTPKELDYCEKHTDELEGKYLCYGHQKQFLDKNNAKNKTN